MDDEIEIDGIIEDEVVDEPSDDETSPAVDGETQPAEGADGFPIIDYDDGGSEGTPQEDDPLPQDEREYVPPQQTVFVTIRTSETIYDYSAASLAAYEASGAVPYAVYDDGTKVEVLWSEVEEPASTASAAVNEAAEVAAATNQHFWSRSTDPDQDGAGTGAFVTDDEQDAFLEAAADGFPDLGDGTNNTKPWHNILMNSLGILLRTGLDNLVSITRSAVAFFDGNGNQSSNVVAVFGADGAQIGKDGASHVELDYHSLTLVDRDSATYFEVKDLRGTDGKATLTYADEGDGHTASFDLPYVATEIVSCNVNGTAAQFTAAGVPSGNPTYTRVTLSSAPASNAVVTIVYKTQDGTARSYTLGTRASGSTVGPSSYAEGIGAEASGYASHAEGDRTKASGRVSHAEGVSTVASGMFSHAEGASATASGNQSHAEGNMTTASGYNSHAEGDQCWAIGGDSHAEGWSSFAIGSMSHAQNERSIAEGMSQTVIGRFNSVDTSDEYCLIIGNGGQWDDQFVDPRNPSYDYDDEYTHSNALTVDWSGNVECAGLVSVTRDSDTVNLSGASGSVAAYSTGSTATVRGYGVTVDSALSNGSTVTIGTVGEGYRPPLAMYGTCASVNSTACGRIMVTVNTNGTVQLTNRSGSNLATTSALYFTVTYVL